MEEKLVAEWRRTRDPRIVEVLRQRLALKPRRAPRSGDLEGAWSAAVEQKNFQELLELLLCGTLPGIEAKVRALGELDDPRVNLVLKPALVALGPAAREDLVPVVVDVLGRSKDVSCIWYLEQYDDEAPDQVDEAIARLNKVKPKQLADLGALVNPKPPREAELYAAVYRDPLDLNARAVLGDALQERGDPRGEFIALQLGPASAASERRCEALLSQHRRAWLSPLQVNESSTDRSRVKAFVRGFLCSAVVDRLEGQEHLREWSTVEHLYVDRMSDNQPALRKLAQSSPALRSLFWLDLDTVSRLDNPRLEQVGLWCAGDVQKKHLAKLTGLRALWLMPSIGFKRATLPWDRLERLFVYDGDWGQWRSQVLAAKAKRLVQVSMLVSSAWMPHLEGWELRFRLDVDPEMKKPELIWHGGSRPVPPAGLTSPYFKKVGAVTVRAPADQQEQLRPWLGKRLIAARGFSRAALKTPALERLTTNFAD